MVGRQYIGNSMWFFLANAMAITFEDAVLGFARRLGFNGPTKWTRRLGYIWDILWFNLLAPYLIDPEMFSLRSGQLVKNQKILSTTNLRLWFNLLAPYLMDPEMFSLMPGQLTKNSRASSKLGNTNRGTFISQYVVLLDVAGVVVASDSFFESGLEHGLSSHGESSS